VEIVNVSRDDFTVRDKEALRSEEWRCV
jgi:hypothetical protein